MTTEIRGNPEVNRRELSNSKEIIFFENGKAVIRYTSVITHQIVLTKEEVDRLEKVLRQR